MSKQEKPQPEITDEERRLFQETEQSVAEDIGEHREQLETSENEKIFFEQIVRMLEDMLKADIIDEKMSVEEALDRFRYQREKLGEYIEKTKEFIGKLDVWKKERGAEK